MLLEKSSRILSKVIEMGDIKIAQIPFKEWQLDITAMVMISINMQSAPTIYQSRLLINTSIADGKSRQSMENNIDMLNKKIDQYKKDYSLKDKIVTELQN